MKRRAWIRVAQVLFIGAVAWGVWRSLGPTIAELRASDLLAFAPAVAPLAVSCALLLAMYLAHAFLWRRILADLDVGRPDARTTLRIHFVSGLGRYIPGKLWQLTSLAVLAREAGLPAAPAAAASLIGHFAFLVTGLLLLAAMLPGWGSGWPAVLGAGGLLAAAAAVWMLVATPLGHGARARLRELLGERFGGRLDTMLVLADRIRPRPALFWLAGYGVTWILLGMAFTIFSSAFVPAAAAAPRLVAGALAASYLAGYVALVPAGIGVREGALATLLAAVPAIPAAGAIVIAVASRLWFTAIEVLPAVAFGAIRPRPGREAA